MDEESVSSDVENGEENQDEDEEAIEVTSIVRPTALKCKT